MLDARTRETDLHQVRCALGDDNFLVRRDMVTMRVGNEREAFCVPWIEPEIVLRQVNAALVANCNHPKKLLRNPGDFHCARKAKWQACVAR